ncbi:MAG: hydrogenase nickel incorporation protein HypB [Thermosynechococcaceae cyanobacterium]
MCTNCGCAQVDSVVLHAETESHTHDHSHTHTLEVRERLLSKNDRFALQNRAVFQSHSLLALNILSSPGSGKTTLIEQTVKAWDDRASVGVIVGDLATENDALRLRAAGATALQITTGTACHLEADMVAHAVSHLNLAHLDLLIIENVGNLVCPAAYDLGETLRVVLLSVTEGEDKPLKYPTAFQSADVVILSKLDIAEAVGFDRETVIANIRRMAPQAQLFEVSARKGFGMDTWLSYLQSQQDRLRSPLEVAR